MTPFAVVGSEQLHNVMGQMVLGRQNGWGLVQIEDPGHCEFHHLRNLLIRYFIPHLCILSSMVIKVGFVLFLSFIQKSNARFD